MDNLYRLPLAVQELLKEVEKKQQRLVLVTGVFDVLHQEHINFLKKAKIEGDVLLVGLETDERVQKIKGNDRPVNRQTERVTNLEQIDLADLVFVLPNEFETDEEHEALIRRLKPMVLAVSSQTPFIATKQSIMSKVGGEVMVVHQHNPTISTTQIINDHDFKQEAR
jgi:D-beta-D-heptose 7-phosphate kinase / D-beta-D-heptose 1-phosphate adenosyltransferase